jgi:hypothetical protein
MYLRITCKALPPISGRNSKTKRNLQLKSVFSTTLIIILLSVPISCKKEKTNPVDDDAGPSVILPLAVGNFWIYERKFLDTAQTVTGIQTDTMTIKDSLFIDGESWYGTGTGSILYTDKPDGVYIRDTLTPLIPPQLMYKYPGYAGNTWVNEIYNDTTTIISNIYSIYILGNAYTFYRYRASDSLGYRETQAVPGLGIIGWSVFLKNSPAGQPYRRELTEITGYYLH